MLWCTSEAQHAFLHFEFPSTSTFGTTRKHDREHPSGNSGFSGEKPLT